MAKSKIADKDTLFENGNAVGVKFSWSDGIVTERRLDEYPEGIRKTLAAYGLRHVLGDSYADAGGDVKIARSLFEKKDAAMMAGNFQARESVSTIFVEAVAKVLGVEQDQALDLCADMDKKAQAEFRKKWPEIGLAEAEIRTERMKSKVGNRKASKEELLEMLKGKSK